MSVWSKKIGGLMVASIVVAAVAGCGGNTGHLPNSPVNNVVEVEGGVQPVNATSNTTVTASDEPQVIEVTVPGSQVPMQVTIPAGVSVNAGQEIAIIPDNTLILNGLNGVNQRDAGDIWLNGHRTGIHVVNGRLHPALGLPAGDYSLVAEGPWRVQQGANVLSVAEFDFNFSCNGRQLSLPTSLTGAIPANGSDNWTNSVTTTFSPQYGTGNATLRIEHLNGVLQRTVQVVNNRATFTDFSEDPQSHIPAQGVQKVIFTHH